METGSVYRRCPTDRTDYNGVRRVSFAVSVILTEKIAQHVALFFPSTQWNYQIEAPNGIPDGSVDLALELTLQQILCP